MMELIKELTEVKKRIEENDKKGNTRPGFLSGFEYAGRIVLRHYRLTQESKGERINEPRR